MQLNPDKIKDEEQENGIPQSDDADDEELEKVLTSGEGDGDFGENGAEGDTLTPNENTVENQGGDGMTNDNSNPETEAEPVQEKMLTQSQVNELVGRARQEGRDSAMKELITRYGVNDDLELDDVFGKGQAYDVLNDDYATQETSYKDALAENALLKSQIDPTRFEDVKLILGGKGLEVNIDNIEALLPSHPEWLKGGAGAGMMNTGSAEFTPEVGDNYAQQLMRKPADMGNDKPGTLRKLGNEASPEPEVSEEEIARKLYNL